MLTKSPKTVILAVAVVSIATAGVSGGASVASAEVPTTLPPKDPGAAERFISGPEAIKLGIVERHDAVTPESETGAAPTAAQRSAAARALAISCISGRHCAFTGGWETGPSLASYAGPGNGYYWNIAEPACATSGISGPIWKNCASSLWNRDPVYGYSVYNNSNNADSGTWKTVPQEEQRDQLGGWNNNIERSAGIGL